MQTRNDLARAFVPNSPFAQRLGLTIERLDADGAELRMPFDPELATLGDTVHGGAIASLIDTAGMTAGWADDAVPESLNGSTVSLNVSYLTAARGTDLTAHAVVTRRGRSLVFSEVRVTEPTGRLVARGTIVQRLG
jgi:uncharacterized protein (TIGR00369 family)